MLAAYIVGGLLWTMIVFYFTYTALHDRKPRKPLPPSPLATYFNGRGERVQRALRREQIFTTDHKGRERLGLK